VGHFLKHNHCYLSLNGCLAPEFGMFDEGFLLSKTDIRKYLDVSLSNPADRPILERIDDQQHEILRRR
jgi:hypothetical protein